MLKKSHFLPYSYGISILTVSLALVLTLLLEPLKEQTPFPLFFAAVMLSTWYGGLGPGLLAVGLSAVTLDYFFLFRVYPFSSGLADIVRLAIFVMVAILISSLHAARDRAERVLRSSETKFRALLESAPDAVIISNKNNQIILVNAQTEKLFGYTREELLGKDINIMLSEQSRHIPDRHDINFASGPTRYPNDERLDITCRRKDRGEFPAEIDLSSVKTEEGNLVITIIRDITERKKAESESIRFIHEQAARAEAETLGRRSTFLAEASIVLAASLDYSATLSNVARLAVPYFADLCIVNTTEDQSIRQVAVAHLDEQKEKLVQDLLSRYQDHPDKSHPMVKALLEGKSLIFPEVSSQFLETAAQDPECLQILHELKPRSLIIVPLLARGRVLGALTFVLTKSNRRYSSGDLALAEDLARRCALAVDNARLYQEVQKTNRILKEKIRELDDFTHVVSHDLKEPLRGIEAFSGFLLEDYAGLLDEQGKRYLTFLKSSAVRMKDLIHDLLTLASISQKGTTAQEVDLNQILKDVQHELVFSIQQKEVEIRIASPLPTIHCDPIQISEVFKNLLSNAIKFNLTARPQIEIAASETEGFYLFSIKDNGIGIDPRYVKQIFHLFKRLHSQEDFPGTGAGLAICKKIVEGSGGKIWVESLPGKGSTFLFTMPRKVVLGMQ